ncbi:MAG: hypothetical protein RMJ56_13570 [Gemmataceae bacterium]|nr:hypothetical protein [Gemmata sp.]MDW8198622.1 hypothetical protein [Gemmataceae bacterium]
MMTALHTLLHSVVLVAVLFLASPVAEAEQATSRSAAVATTHSSRHSDTATTPAASADDPIGGLLVVAAVVVIVILLAWIASRIGDNGSTMS